MSILKTGGPVLPPEQNSYPQQHQEQESSPPPTEIETPIGKFTFTDWFGVAAICVIILVVGIVKKYFWNTNSTETHDTNTTKKSFRGPKQK